MEHKNELSQPEIKSLLSRMPTFELSYEIFKHNTTAILPLADDEWSFHIPVGPKWFAWFSFRGKKHGVFWMELNKRRVVQRVFFQEALPPSSTDISAFYGTVFFGTQVQDRFVLEDVYYFRGNFVHCLSELNKWTLLPPFLKQHSQYGLCLPIINGAFEKPVPYPTHHIQIRHLTKICPFTNWTLPKNNFSVNISEKMATQEFKPAFKNWRKEQYQLDTVFSVQADPADDIYRLFTYGPNKTLLFYDYCMIPDYETSKKMNSLFRHVRENRNLDWIEESDDEEDTPVSEQHKLITCRFHPKFRKWIPFGVASNKSRVVHICQL